MGKNETLILSLDIGTTAIKVGLFSETGNLIRLTSREQELIFPAPNRVEQCLSTTWGLICEATREVTSDLNSRQIHAISLSCQRGSVVPLDKNGDPLTNMIVWMDQRGLSQIEYLKDLIGNENYYKICGHPLVPITGVSKVLWLKNEDSRAWDKTAFICPPQTFFLKKLGCEEFITDTSTGSYHFPCNIHKKIWSQEIAAAVDFPLAKLPQLVPSTHLAGKLCDKAAQDMNLTSGITLIAGGGDGQCAAVGAGIVNPGNVMVNIGTAAGVQVFLSKPTLDPSHTLNCASHVVSGAWEMEGHTQASGAVLRWFRDEFGEIEKNKSTKSQLDAYDHIIKQANQVPAGSEGLIFFPTFNGSTAPIVDPSARGGLLGLQLSHNRSHIIRSILEGISLEIRWMLDTLTEIGVSVNEVRLSGGGSKNKIWNQIHADILNRPIRAVTNSDGALVGAAICGAVALEIVSDFQAGANRYVKMGPAIQPLPENQQIYEKTYRRYVRLFEAMSEQSMFTV